MGNDALEKLSLVIHEIYRKIQNDLDHVYIFTPTPPSSIENLHQEITNTTYDLSELATVMKSLIPYRSVPATATATATATAIATAITDPCYHPSLFIFDDFMISLMENDAFQRLIYSMRLLNATVVISSQDPRMLTCISVSNVIFSKMSTQEMIRKIHRYMMKSYVNLYTLSQYMESLDNFIFLAISVDTLNAKLGWICADINEHNLIYFPRTHISKN